MPDIYGDVIDAGTIEDAFQDTLKLWLPGQLAHQERRRSLSAATLPQPRSWPLMSDFDIEVQEQLPAIFLVSSGATGYTHTGGVYRGTWRIEAGVVVAGKDERQARLLASLYLAAVKAVPVQDDPTLGGVAEVCRLVGPDDHAFGITPQRAQRAIYGTAFEVTVHGVLDARRGPVEPPDDPYNPPGAPASPLTANIEVIATRPEDTP